MLSIPMKIEDLILKIITPTTFFLYILKLFCKNNFKKYKKNHKLNFRSRLELAA